MYKKNTDISMYRLVSIISKYDYSISEFQNPWKSKNVLPKFTYYMIQFEKFQNLSTFLYKFTRYFTYLQKGICMCGYCSVSTYQYQLKGPLVLY